MRRLFVNARISKTIFLKSKNCWLLAFIGLTFLILVFPIHLVFMPSSIESLTIFGNESLFAVLFYVWVATGLLLLLKVSNPHERWMHALVIAVFAIVFLGFWIFITPGRSVDDIYTLAHVRYAQVYGTVSPEDPNFSYLSWPGLVVLGSTVCSILGVDLFTMRIIVMLVIDALFPILVYLLFRNSLCKGRIAIVASVIFLLGNAELARDNVLAPVSLGYLFFVLFLVFFSRQRYRWSKSDIAIMVIFFAALTVTYLLTSLVLLAIVSAVELFRIRSKKSSLDLRLPLLMVLTIVMWQGYWALSSGANLIEQVSSTLSGSLSDPFFYLQQSAAGGIAPLPFWGNFTQFFWLIVTLAIGSLIGLVTIIGSLLKRVTLDFKNNFVLLSFLGVWLFCILVVVSSPLGSQMHRFFMYLPFFTVPILFLYTQKHHWGKYVVTILLVSALVLSFPTFLVDHKQVVTTAVYPSELKGYQFIENSYGITGQPYIFTTVSVAWPLRLYSLNAHEITQPIFISNDSEIWREMNLLVDKFSGGPENSLFIFSLKILGMYSFYPTISENSSDWQSFQSTLNLNDKTYDDNFLSLYLNK